MTLERMISKNILLSLQAKTELRKEIDEILNHKYAYK